MDGDLRICTWPGPTELLEGIEDLLNASVWWLILRKVDMPVYMFLFSPRLLPLRASGPSMFSPFSEWFFFCRPELSNRGARN